MPQLKNQLLHRNPTSYRLCKKVSLPSSVHSGLFPLEAHVLDGPLLLHSHYTPVEPACTARQAPPLCRGCHLHCKHRLPAAPACADFPGPPRTGLAMAGPPSKLDLHLEGLAAFQEGAAALKAGDPLCLQQLDGARLACSTRDGVAVGLVPADKRGLLSRGPWSGTVRSVKRQQVAPAAGGGQASGSVPATAGATAAGGAPAGEQTAAQQEQQQSAAAAAAAPKQGQLGAQPSAGSTDPPAPAPLTAEAEGQQGQPAAAPQLSVVQVLVRFSPEEQRWEQRAPEAPALPEEEDAARLSADQLQMLGEGRAGHAIAVGGPSVCRQCVPGPVG